MTVAVVTDSSSDLTLDLAKEMNISIVPLYVRFGNDVFREDVNITKDQFFEKLVKSSVHPATAQPSPQDFMEVYKEVAKKASAIISIHISGKMSGTIASANLARDMLGETKVPIEIVDTNTTTGALGLVVLAAARAAASGKDLDEVKKEAEQALQRVQLFGLVDTLKYLEKGGRIGKAKALMGTMLGVKPVLTVKEGEVTPAGQVRTRAKGIEKLLEELKNVPKLEEVMVGYTTTGADAAELAGKISAIYTNIPVRVFRIGTTIGTHVGPGTLVVAFRSQV